MDTKPVYIPQYRQAPGYLEEAERMKDNWLVNGLVRESFSSWNAPILMIKKPDGTL
jgi:hypothetical protein